MARREPQQFTPTNWVEMNMPMRRKKKAAEQSETKPSPSPTTYSTTQHHLIELPAKRKEDRRRRA